MKRILSVCLFIMLSLKVVAQEAEADTNPLNDDTYLHPFDGITPYTMKKGEWFYGQSLQTLPGPGWAFWGITDKLTVQLDFTPLIGGLFFDPNLPIPSVSARYKLVDQRNMLPTISMEMQFFHFWGEFERFDVNNYELHQDGSYFHTKVMWGYQIEDVFLNFSGGFDYFHQMWWEKDGEIIYSMNQGVNPNGSFGVDYRSSKWISYHMALSYGSTLTYFENVPRKIQFNYGFRMAPFYRNRYKFLRNMRIELISINGWFPDIDQYSGISLPIYPLFYWQWGGRS